MNANRLREAAKVLRERAEAAAKGPWKYPHRNYPGVVMAKHGCLWVPSSKDRHDSGHLNNEADGHFIAMMQPLVAVALADWLDATADEWTPTALCGCGEAGCDGDEQPHVRHAIAVADLILGGGVR